MNRCHLCGQCFKLVRHKDEYSEINDYYSFMFSSITHFGVQEDDANIPLQVMFGDRPHPAMQSLPATNVYIHVNPDEADHLLVDPAYRMQKLTEAHEKLYAMQAAYDRVGKSMKHIVDMPIATSTMIYSNWFDIEKSIRRLDRHFLKVEKYNARQFIDPDNHERRELRMLERKRERWTDNYTYFFGGLTEEEQMYRDYFLTDIENEPEDDVLDEYLDEVDIARSGEFRFDRYEFVESNIEFDNHEELADIVNKKIFKFKYRLNNDDYKTYLRRMDRVVKRQLERAKTRDPKIEMNLAEMFEKHEREQASGALIHRMAAGEPFSVHATAETQPIRDYMLKESVEIYRDYYESDTEEQSFFEYLNELPNRDRLKLIDIYEDFTIPKRDGKGFVKVPKREHNPELSLFSNVALDLIDFKDRVLPLAQDAARLDGSLRYQRNNAQETKDTIREGRDRFNKYLTLLCQKFVAVNKKSPSIKNFNVFCLKNMKFKI